MGRLSFVKIALFNLMMLSQTLHAFSTTAEMPCGTYKVQGVLAINNQNMFVLKVQANTSSPYELLVFGGKAEEKFRQLGDLVAMKVYVNQPIRGGAYPFVLFEQWAAPNLDPAKAVIRLHEKACGLKNTYKVN